MTASSPQDSASVSSSVVQAQALPSSFRTVHGKVLFSGSFWSDYTAIGITTFIANGLIYPMHTTAMYMQNEPRSIVYPSSYWNAWGKALKKLSEGQGMMKLLRNAYKDFMKILSVDASMITFSYVTKVQLQYYGDSLLYANQPWYAKCGVDCALAGLASFMTYFFVHPVYAIQQHILTTNADSTNPKKAASYSKPYNSLLSRASYMYKSGILYKGFGRLCFEQVGHYVLFLGLYDTLVREFRPLPNDVRWDLSLATSCLANLFSTVMVNSEKSNIGLLQAFRNKSQAKIVFSGGLRNMWFGWRGMMVLSGTEMLIGDPAGGPQKVEYSSEKGMFLQMVKSGVIPGKVVSESDKSQTVAKGHPKGEKRKKKQGEPKEAEKPVENQSTPPQKPWSWWKKYVLFWKKN